MQPVCLLRQKMFLTLGEVLPVMCFMNFSFFLRSLGNITVGKDGEMRFYACVFL